MKSKKSLRMIAMIAAFCVAFTSLPLMTGSLDADAMAKKKKAKVAKTITLKASASGQTKAVLSWNKIKKPQKGYAVFRDGRVIAHLGKKLSFTDTGLKAGTGYTYQIKVYKTKKVKMWYNKKTGQWQKKKPKKKYRGKSKKITTYKYQKPSGKVYVKTAAAPKPAATAVKPAARPAAPTMKTQQAVAKPSTNTSGSTTKPTTPTTGGSTTTPITGTNTSRYPIGTVLTATDYLGDVKKYTKVGTDSWINASTGNTVSESNVTRNINNPQYNKSIDGEFTISGGKVMLQKGGVTFVKEQLNNPVSKTDNLGRATYTVEMYNGDENKLILELQNPTSSVSTYTDKFVSTTKQFVMKDGFRLIDYYGSETTARKGNKITKVIRFGDLEESISSCGFVSGDVVVRIKYNEALMGTIRFNPNANANANGLHPRRQFYLDVAKAAVTANGGKKSYADDWHAIRDYVYDNYQYPPEGENGLGPDYINCLGGARVFETYSIYEYGVYGFMAYPPNSSNPDEHMAFYRDDAPNGIKYETQGHK